MPKKTFNAVESNNRLTFAKKKLYQKFYTDFFSNLAESLLIKLPKSINKYSIEYVLQFHSKLIVKKLSGKDKLSGKCFKNGAEILARLINEIFNFLISSRIFANVFQKN